MPYLEDDADRNFLRNNVIPLIEKRYKGAMRAVNALSRECDCVCGMLDGMLDDALLQSFHAVYTELRFRTRAPLLLRTEVPR